MSALNKVCLLGRLGKDPEIRSTTSGKKCANFSIATEEKWKDKNTGEKKSITDWHNIVVWGDGLVGVIEQYVSKGSQVYIEGALKTRKWQDKEGNDRYTTEVVVQGMGNKLILCGGNSGGSGNHASAPEAPPASADEIDDDIPF